MLAFLLSIIAMCERLSFAGIKSFIMIYLSEFLLIDNKSLYTIIASYTFLSFFFCIIGSLLSNRCDMIFLGLAIKIIGYIYLYFFPGFENALLGLSLLSIGQGILKNSVTYTYLSLFKSPTAINTFYIFMNLGLFVSPIICSYCITFSYFLPLLVLMITNCVILLFFSFYTIYNSISHYLTINNSSNHSISNYISNCSPQYNNLFHNGVLLFVAGYIISLVMDKTYFFHILILCTFLMNIYFTYTTQKSFYTYYILISFTVVTIFQTHIESLQLFYIKYLTNILWGMHIPLPLLYTITPLTIMIMLNFDHIWPTAYSHRLLITTCLIFLAYINLYIALSKQNFTIAFILPVLFIPGIIEAIIYIKILEYISKQNNNKFLLSIILHNIGIAYYIASIININKNTIEDFQSLFLNNIYIAASLIILMIFINNTNHVLQKKVK